MLGKKELTKMMCDSLGFKVPLREVKYRTNYFGWREMVSCSVCYGGVCIDGSVQFLSYGD